MHWLNANAGSVQTVATIVLVAVTIGYVVLTSTPPKKLPIPLRPLGSCVSESRLSRLASFDALVFPLGVTYVKPSPVSVAGDPAVEEHFLVELHNFGPAAAFDVLVGYRMGSGGLSHFMEWPMAGG